MILLLRRPARLHAAFVLMLACFASASAHATADGPDHFRVVGVSANGVLNMRASPGRDGAIVGTIPSDADGLANFGCRGGLTASEYEAATEAEREAARKTRWCKVGYDRTIGWAAGWFLAEGRSGDGFRGGAILGSLAGSEWKVRDFAGRPTKIESWIAFRADGAVVGNGGCNQIRGSYSENGGSLDFGPIAATMMACPDPKMQAERDLLAALDATHEAVATRLFLALFDGSGRLLATMTRRDWD